MSGASINTVSKLLLDAGVACAKYQRKTLRDLTCKRIQCDETWSFCGMKEKHVPDERNGERGVGDLWTWTAICADTELVPCWLVGARDRIHAAHFIADLASRLTHRVQLTTDGHRPYLEAVEGAFGGDIDYAMLVKMYGSGHGDTPETRYSPGECIGIEKRPILGHPDDAHISTSYAERQNLTIAHADETLHSADERIQQEDREPRSGDRPALHALQFRPPTPGASGFSRDGSGRDETVMVDRGYHCADPSTQTKRASSQSLFGSTMFTTLGTKRAPLGFTPTTSGHLSRGEYGKATQRDGITRITRRPVSG